MKKLISPRTSLIKEKTISIVYLAFCLTTLSFKTTMAQNVGINAFGTSPNPSAMLDISSSNSGVLIPQISLTISTSATPITSPATSLLIYNTATVNDVTPGYYYWNGSKWVRLISTTGQQVNSVTNTAITQLIGNNTGTYANLLGGPGWTIGTWQDVTGLTITRTVPAGNYVNVSFSIAGLGNFFSNYTPQEIVFRIVRDGTTQIGKANSMGQTSTSWNYYYFNCAWNSFDFISDGLSHTWKIQFWMSNTTASTESVWVEDRNITVTEIAP